MDTEFWLERWENNQTGFHQPGINTCLQRYWPQLGLAQGSRVLVPLCGKSIDMRWLAEQGYQVIGIELSRLAAAAFYRENDMTPVIHAGNRSHHYACDNIEIVCADFFCLAAEDIGPVDAFYDRAALIALTPAQRRDYASCLMQLLPADTPGLLITLDYNQSEMNGPPFAVPEAEVNQLFGACCTIDLLSSYDALEENLRFRERGISALTESVYQLRRR